MAKESAYLAFPFRFRAPRVRIDVAGGIAGSGVPAVPGGARHMRAMRDWISLEEDGYAVAWTTPDVPLVQIGGIALPYAPFPPTIDDEPATLVSWVHNNVWDTNFPSQQGFDQRFRYSIAAGSTDEAGGGAGLGHRTAAAATRPLRAVLARGDRGSDGSDAAATRLLALDAPGVELVDLVTDADGRLLVRLRSLVDEAVAARVRLGVPIADARRATYLGDTAGPVAVDGDAVSIEIPPRAVGAILLTLEGA
jgi:hypothetical protein